MSPAAKGPVRERAAAWLPLVLAAIPPLVLASMVANFGVDVPYWDQWDLVPDLEKLYAGGLGLSDLWAQHSEHRVLVPRALMLGLARLTGWDVRYELWLSLLLALLSAGLCLRLWRAARANAGVSAFAWLPAIGSLGLFSLRQWENWLWGWQLTIHLTVLALLAGLVLARRAKRPLALAALLALGLVAQYSFATGLAYWPIVGLVVAASFERGDRSRGWVLLAWTAVSATALASYLYGYRKPPWTPDTGLALERPGGFLLYVLAYLGSPLTPESESGWRLPWAVTAGLLGIFAFVASARALRRRGLGTATLAPFAGLAGYAVVSAMLGGVGRLGLGPEQALASRYVTLGQWLWLSDLGLLALVAAAEATPRRQRRLAIAALTVATLTLAVASASAGGRFVEAYRRLGAARAALRAHADTPALAVLHPDRELLWRRAQVLERLRLSVYR